MPALEESSRESTAAQLRRCKCRSCLHHCQNHGTSTSANTCSFSKRARSDDNPAEDADNCDSLEQSERVRDRARWQNTRAQKQAVYPACTSVKRLWLFGRFWRCVKSITCVFSILGAVPSPVVPAILFHPINHKWRAVKGKRSPQARLRFRNGTTPASANPD
jgi:hypothetical protein